MHYVIEPMKPEDWPHVRTIYRDGILTGNSTFETDPPAWNTWDAAHLPDHRLVIRRGDRILAWVALSPVSNRCVYAGIAEVSLYVAESQRRQGLGAALLQALIKSSEQAGIWSLQGGIFPENTASLGLVKGCGFREIGRREKAGKMTYGQFAGTWRDVILVERRSRVAGVD